jgi:glycosyltransferase involved in cell wall biosynthesis
VTVREAARRILSLAPLAGLVSRPEPRPAGISAVVRVRGEEEWVAPCLRSIRDLADEIVVLDNGAAPAARAALRSAQGERGPRVRVEACPDLDLFALSNRGLDLARYRWVVRWDADFVAHTSGPGDVRHLRQHLLALDARRYHLVYLPAAELAGDLEHQFPDRPVRADGQAHTASPRARYVPVERALARDGLATPDRVLRDGPVLRIRKESLRVPRYYAVSRWPRISYFHVNVKSARHTFLRHYWLEWLGQGDFRAYPTLEAYALARSRADWGIADPDAAARHFMARYCAGLVPVDTARCGPHPDLLAPDRAEARYRVEYAGGRIVGRADRAPAGGGVGVSPC